MRLTLILGVRIVGGLAKRSSRELQCMLVVLRVEGCMTGHHPNEPHVALHLLVMEDHPNPFLTKTTVAHGEQLRVFYHTGGNCDHGNGLVTGAIEVEAIVDAGHLVETEVDRRASAWVAESGQAHEVHGS